MNQYFKRRQNVSKLLQENYVSLVFSGKALMCSQDDAYPFHVDRNFYYLTGLDAEDMVLLMSNFNGVYQEMIFILPYDELQAKWVGGRMLAEEVSQISEIKDVRDLADLDAVVERILDRNRGNSEFKFYFDMWHYTMNQHYTEASKYAHKLMKNYPYLTIKDNFSALTASRLVKDETEIDSMRKAIHITNLGIKEMMLVSKPGVNESVMEGVFDFVLKNNLCKELAFSTIAASGKNATILHYRDNNQYMNDGDLFLCDLGATYNHYCADVSRTFPVNGKFTDRQKEIYNIVLGAQKVVENNAKPGIKIRELNQMVIDYYKQELPKHNLTKDVSEYYYHSISHHIGLDCHDVDGGMGSVLQAGNVISNEPGLYIEDESIGIRIEDDLLITDDGCEVLSAGIIKSVEDIENFMSSKNQ